MIILILTLKPKDNIMLILKCIENYSNFRMICEIVISFLESHVNNYVIQL